MLIIKLYHSWLVSNRETLTMHHIISASSFQKKRGNGPELTSLHSLSRLQLQQGASKHDDLKDLMKDFSGVFNLPFKF